jgi:hypothetical protein
MQTNEPKATCTEGPRQGVTVKVAPVALVLSVKLPMVHAGARVRVRPVNWQ